jgi:hypothetical protein
MKVRLSTAAKSLWAGRDKRLTLLLAAAAILHVCVATSIFTVGKLGLMPSQFNEKGLGNFASDGVVYQTEMLELCDVLRTQGVAAWASWPTQLHVRLYSLPLAALQGLSGFNILAIEPLNLIYYLAILTLVFKLGTAVFDHRAGLLAATIVGLWPSFLLHTTQVLRDPLLITAFLILVWSLIQFLKRDYTWRRGLLWSLPAALAILVIRIVRLPMWDFLWVIIGLAFLMLIVRSVRQRRFPLGHVCFAIVIIAMLVITPRFQANLRNQQYVSIKGVLLLEEVQKESVEGQIAKRREGFVLEIDATGDIVPSSAGSNIDKGVRFKGVADIIRYIPRAAVVGFFAPFPGMWLTTGRQVGASGRLLSGFEIILTYLIEALALLGLWSARKHLATWFLSLTATGGVVVLGLVVINMGALYRLRYPFWVLLVVLGAGGASYLMRRRERSTSPVTVTQTVSLR